MRWMVLAADGDSGLPVYAYLFWALFIGYAAWYGMRLYRKSATRREQEASGSTSPLGATKTPPTPPRPAAPGPSAPRRSADPAPFSSAAASSASTAPPPSTPAAPRPVANAGAGTDGASTRSGLFAAASTGERPADQARRPVAAILRGITMPDALAPVINPGASDASGAAGMRVAFSANGADPGRVGRAVGDELERLGFTLRSLGDTQLGATRDHDELVVTIFTDPAGVERLGGKAFPTLPSGAFVVEFESV